MSSSPQAPGSADAEKALFRVLITDEVAEECLDTIRQAAGFEVDYRPGLSAEDVLEAIGEADALLVRSATKVTAEVINRSDRLRVVARAGVGVDNIDIDAATRRGVLVMNAPEGNTLSAAEHTLALLFALVRRIAAADRSVREGRWERSSFLGTQLTGKTLGLIGLGKVGREVASRARGLQMEVVAFDPVVSQEQAQRLEVELLPFDAVIERADILSVHVPLTERTRGLVGDEQFDRAKRGVLIVNCARGGVIDEDALARALEDGRVGGAALDVFAEEPLGAESALRQSPRTVLTPHLGASTREAQELVGTMTARQIVAYLCDGAITNAVNMVRIDPQVLARVAPYMDLAEKIGRLQAQLLHGKIERIEVTYAGAGFDEEARPILTRALLRGFFDDFLDTPVNYVNVTHFAAETGIHLGESCDDEAEGYRELMTARVLTSEGERRVAGTLFGERRPRIVLIDDYSVDLTPDGHVIMFANDDTPGIMGMAGTILGSNGVNIAYMSMGRDEAGGTALAVLGVDEVVPDAVFEILKTSRGIVWVRRVQL